MVTAQFRVLEGTFDQLAFFELRARGFLQPDERLPRSQELARWLREGPGNATWFSNWYVAYRRDFGALGHRITWGEPGEFWSFEVPEGGLREQFGILVVDADKLRVDLAKREVAPAPGFDPTRDAFGIVDDTRKYSRLDGEMEERLGGGGLSTAFFKFCDGRVNGWHGSLVVDTVDPLREGGDPVRPQLEARHAWKVPMRVAAVRR